jgi:hypothetical protein
LEFAAAAVAVAKSEPPLPLDMLEEETSGTSSLVFILSKRRRY